MKLTDLICKRAKPGMKGATSKTPGAPCAARYFDGGGLYLNVSVSGHKTWRQQYRIDGIKRVITHGAYGAHLPLTPTEARELQHSTKRLLNLSEARELRESTKRLLAAGHDPVQRRRAAKKDTTQQRANTLCLFATEHHRRIKGGFRNSKHAAQWLSTLEPVFAVLGERPLSSITQGDVLDVITPIMREHPETGKRTLQRLRAVFDAALLRELVTRNPAAVLNKAPELKALHVKAVHLRALDYRRVPDLVVALNQSERVGGVTRSCLLFALLTAARSGEARGCTWSELDVDKATWIVPAERMKGDEQHWVWLSEQALAALRFVRPLSGGVGLVFPSPNDPREQLSDMTLTAALRRVPTGAKRADGEAEMFGDLTTVHGLCRSSFSTWANEAAGFKSNVIEAALAHKEADRVKAAYDRSSFEEERSRLLNAWGQYCSGVPLASH